MEGKGLVQVYTGDGKGKTSAAVGQAIRAAGHGCKVGFAYFFKSPADFQYGEPPALQKLGIEVFRLAPHHPRFHREISLSQVREECLSGLEFIKGLFADQSWDMLVLDELNIALRDGFLEEAEVLALLEAKPPGLEIVLTGRGASPGIVARADLVSEIKSVKHPLGQGVPRRRGIEY